MSPKEPPATDAAAAYARALVDTSLDALYALTPEGRVLCWNWGAENLYGYAASEAVGRFLHELTVPPERWDAVRAMLREALLTGSALGETQRLRKDRTPVEVQAVYRIVPGGAEGETFLAASEKDITDGKRLEAEAFEKVWSLTDVQDFLNSILEGSEDYSIIAMDLDGRIQAWNQGAHHDFGYNASEAMGKHGPALIHAPEDFASGNVQDALREALARGKLESEFTCRRKDGSRFPAKLTIRVRRNAYDKPVGYVVIGQDVTAEKQRDEERRKAFEQAAELQRLRDEDEFKTRFINTAAHELGTPLTPIKMQVHQLRHVDADRLTDRQRKAIDVLDRNLTRLTRLLKDVLDVARLQGGRFPLRKAPTDLAHLARESVEGFEQAAAEGGVSIEVLAPPTLLLDADPDRIQQVLSNLLANALKFTPRGGHVRVRVSADEDGALVQVEDTGIGLTPEQIGRLFLPFSQVHDTMQRTHAGAGLGLSISKGIVEEHGGRISCESAGEGKGAVFRFVLPRNGPSPP